MDTFRSAVLELLRSGAQTLAASPAGETIIGGRSQSVTMTGESPDLVVAKQLLNAANAAGSASNGSHRAWPCCSTRVADPGEVIVTRAIECLASHNGTYVIGSRDRAT